MITKVIKALNFSEIVSLSNINAELEAFQIGKIDKGNIPQRLSESVLKQTRLLGTAAQNWCLFRILPFLIGHYIPQGEAHWAVYLKCREIGEIILSPRIKKNSHTFSQPSNWRIPLRFPSPVSRYFPTKTALSHTLSSPHFRLWTFEVPVVHEV